MDPALCKALFALGRLSETFTGSAVAAAWAARSRIDAVARVLRADGLGVDHERVLRLSYDLPVSGRIDIGSDADALQVIAALDGGSESGGGQGALAADLGEAETAFLSVAEGPNPGPLLGGLWSWLDAGRRPSAGHIAFIRCLAATGLTPAPLGALARPPGPTRQGRATWITESLVRLAGAADAARGDLAALALTVTEWRRRLGHRRRHSRMNTLVGEVASLLVVTPAAIARRLGLSLRGASVMLEELATLGIVVEVTGRKSWKVFVPSDLVVAMPGERNRRREIRPPVAIDRTPDLAPLLDDAGSAIARVQAAMARLKSDRERERKNEIDTPAEDEPAEDQPSRRS